jgi:hypothetical protein
VDSEGSISFSDWDSFSDISDTCSIIVNTEASQVDQDQVDQDLVDQLNDEIDDMLTGGQGCAGRSRESR